MLLDMNSSLSAASPQIAAPEASASAGASNGDPVAVALMGSALPSSRALTDALSAAHAAPVRFDVVDVNTAGRPVRADIVICASPKVAIVAAMCWPDADVIVLVPTRDDDSAVLDAVEAGAVCVRGSHVDLIAAYVHAVVRRRNQTRRSSK
jgi:hypothetical protein